MARDAASCLLLLVSITAAAAFHAPSVHYGRVHYGHAYALEKARAPRAPQHAVHSPIRRQLFEQPVIEAETMSISSVLESAREPMVIPLVTLADTVPMSSPAATSTLIGGAVFLAMMKLYHLGWVAAPVSWTLAVHAAAGAIGGLVALASSSAVSGKDSSQALKTVMESFKITALSKAANAFTFAYVNQAMASFALGSAGIVAAAAGVGVVATLVQQLSMGAVKTTGFFQDNVLRNVFVFEAFWLTYAGLCALSPAWSITYTGLMISGGISGIVATVASSVQFGGGARGFVQHFRTVAQSVRKSIDGVEFSKAAFQSGIFFVVYQAVYNTLM